MTELLANLAELRAIWERIDSPVIETEAPAPVEAVEEYPEIEGVTYV